MHRKRILYADDNPVDVELTLHALGGIGLGEDVAVVADGVAVMDYLGRCEAGADHRSDTPQLILLDLRMPRMDGVATLSAIRQHPALRTMPVVMLSVSAEAADLARCYRTGANAYVVKPATSERFAAVIESVGAFWLGVNEPPPQLQAVAG